jgi:integrase/recombinase XerC
MSLTQHKQSQRGSAADLTDAQVKAAIALAGTGAQAARNTLLLRLSLTLGLRVSDMAGLEWRDCLNASGEVSDTLIIRPETAKYGSGAKLPIPTQVRKALNDLLDEETRRYGTPKPTVPLFRSQRGFMQRHSLVGWFKRLYAQAGAKGASSHSGRRYAITKMARNISLAKGSLRDVQAIARHKSIATTQRYIAVSAEAQSDVLRMVDRLVR